MVLDKEDVLVRVWVARHFEAVHLHHDDQLGHRVPHLDVLLILQSAFHSQKLLQTQVFLGPRLSWASKDLYFDICRLALENLLSRLIDAQDFRLFIGSFSYNRRKVSLLQKFAQICGLLGQEGFANHAMRELSARVVAN